MVRASIKRRKRSLTVKMVSMMKVITGCGSSASENYDIDSNNNDIQNYNNTDEFDNDNIIDAVSHAYDNRSHNHFCRRCSLVDNVPLDRSLHLPAWLSPLSWKQQ